MKKLLVLFILLLSVNVWAKGVITIPYMQSPKIDGIVEKQEWQYATCITGFHKRGSKYLDPSKSFVYIGYDEKNLYVAYKFYGEEKPIGIENDSDSDYWNDDALEFLIAKDEKNKIWNQFIMNWCGGFVAYSNDPKTSGGKQVGESFGTPITVDKTKAYYISPAFDDLSSKEEKYWSGEISVTWESLGMNPKEGDKTSILACRDRVVGKENIISTSIGYVNISFFEMDSYFSAVFTDKEPIVQMTDYTYPGDNLKLFNPTKDQKNITISDSYIKGDKNITKTHDIVLLPGETKEFASKDYFSDSFFAYKTQVQDKDSKTVLLDVQNNIINGEVFSYNLSEDGIFTMKINALLAPPNSFPIVNIKMKYNNNLLTAYYYKKINEGEITEIKFDTKLLPHGDYKLHVNIDGIINEIFDVKL